MGPPMAPCGRVGGEQLERLLGVTEGSHSPQDPVIGAEVRPKHEHGDERQVSTVRFLVDGTLVEARISRSCLDGVHMNDGHW